jgi:two-component system, LuxR family, sensor kinase FixL
MLTVGNLGLYSEVAAGAAAKTSDTWRERMGRLPTTVTASVLLVILYVALDAASFVFPFHPLPVTPWNPNAGLAIAMVIAGGPSYAPAVVIATLAAELALHSEGTSLLANVAAGVGLGIAYILTAIAVRHLAPATALDRVRDLRIFLCVALIGTAVSAGCYVEFNLPATVMPTNAQLAAFLSMWLGDLTGTVGMTPLLLLIDARRRSPEALETPGDGGGWSRDVVLFLVALAALLALIFGIEPIEGHKLFYLLFVPLIALAMRRGFAGAAVGVAVVQIALIGALIATDRSAQAATEFQFLMLVLGVSTLLLGSVASERKRALSELAQRSAELRSQQAALAEALRVAAASEMASALAHELAQPLSAIGTYARAGLEMLRHGAAAPADIARALERVENEAARSGKAVRRIRDFFRSGTSQFEPIHIDALVQEAAAAVRDRVEAQGAHLRIDVAPDLPIVLADRVQIGTVLHNLLTNALDATVDASAIALIQVIAYRSGPESVALEVADSGPGVAMSVRQNLFEPLATTKPSGMGLGLAISRTIVEAHGGQLRLAQERPTTFRLTLPLHVVSVG